MQRSIGAIVATCAVLALPATAAASTKTVFAGPPPTTQKLAGKVLGKSFVQTYNPDVNDFFLHRVTINAGDSVSFIQAGFHTIDLPGKSGQDLPLILASSTKVSDVKDAAGSPFWFNGVVPNLNLNPALFARSKSTVYNGSTRLDSGLPPNSGKPKPFTVKFTKAGVYKYFCDIHLGMVGFVVVKPKGKTVPTAKQDAAALKTQITGDLNTAKGLAKTKVAADNVSLGEGAPGGVELFTMFPSTLTVKTGTTVTFSISKNSREVHTATFGPVPYLTALANGLFATPGPTAQGAYPSSPTQPILLNTTSHGNGFGNIGVVDTDSTSPNPTSGKITFTAPGTYNFICLVHPFMHGTVVVTP
jgi:plastocyanin